MLTSLFVVSLPRSLSTLTYGAARQALGLREPAWSTDGEILNVRRFAHLAEEGTVEGVKYTERCRDGDRFGRLLGFLDQVTTTQGFAYKDVIQPFVVAEWLPASGLNVLKIERPLPDVAYAMLARGWLYPASADGFDGPSPAGGDTERSLLCGLARAQQALSRLNGPAVATVRYDDLIGDEQPLWAALRRLYGPAAATRPSYIDPDFTSLRQEVLDRRQTELYQRLHAIAHDLVGAEPRPARPRGADGSRSAASLRIVPGRRH
ncbi:MAG TPA: hypothetical protein VHR45_15830 [Thermoanaerobaculia bacterium]|nr:hypothetical protein [Thermoanaerobaculia bacterium]